MFSLKESLVGGSDSCSGALNSILPTLLDQTLILASAKDCNAPGHNKLKTKYPTGPRGCLGQVQNSRDLGLETSSWPDVFSSAMYIRNVVIDWRCLSYAALHISLKKKGSIKNSTQQGWDKGTKIIFILRETTQLPPSRLFLAINSKL